MIPKVLLLIDFSEEYGRGLLNGIAKYSRLFGPWSFCRIPLVYRNKSDVPGLVTWAKNWGTDGIIAQIENEDVLSELCKLDRPIIAQDVNERFAGIPNITGLYRETGIMAAEYLLEKGFKEFAFYGFDNIVWSRERCDGFCERISQASYKVHIYEQPKEDTPPLWSYKESQLSQWLTSLPKPVAIMCCDDNQGQHVTEVCNAIGINVPEQVAVMGVDNDLSICNLSDPPLSSISLNTEKAGFEAAQLLSKMMQDKYAAWENIYAEPISVIPRRSTDFLAVEDAEVKKALQFVQQRFKDEINVDDVVKATFLSRRVLEKRFQLGLKRTILDEINSQRVEYAKQLLIETDLPVSEIAFLCGRTDAKNFSRYFSNREHITPHEFRKMKRRN